ncbi:MAG: hypothetical protein K2G19_09365, partial [Lachnospiraceae bacterium]|nr:hypothetical protein [Lachnospiraceae bacterium]
YDELYTYYCFISKGPLYAAIHWPLPNNHVGYSVLSAFLDYLGNPYIGLRGISYLCALANICLLYKIAEKYKKGWMPLAVVILYVSMNLVNQLAVQGRGYTLGITCFLTAWLCMTAICGGKKAGRKVYAVYALSLVLGLYAVSSNVYWVVPLCIAGGCCLLFKGIQESRERTCFVLKTESGKKLVKLVAASVAAALGTVFLYGLIWLAIGSNLLVKDISSAYYGMGHVKMILQAPFAAIGRGMEYMLDTPYIQSEERAGFFGRFWEWLQTLSGYFYPLSSLVMIIWGIGILFALYRIVKGIRAKAYKDMLLYLVLFWGIILVPVCLLIQCKRPYYRVFTYGGVFLAMLLGVLADFVLTFLAHKSGKKKDFSFILFLGAVAVGVKCLGFSGYHTQYGVNEYEIQDAFSQGDMKNRQAICVTDCNQEYLLYFLYGIRCENREIEGADAVLLDKRMTDPDFTEMVWEFYHYYDT